MDSTRTPARHTRNDDALEKLAMKAVALFFRSVRLVILFRSCWVLLGFVLWVILFGS